MIDLEIVILTEVSQTEKDKYVIPFISKILKNDTKEHIQHRNRLTDTETKTMVTKVEKGGKIRSLGSTDTCYYTQNRLTKRPYCIAQRATFSVPPGQPINILQ